MDTKFSVTFVTMIVVLFVSREKIESMTYLIMQKQKQKTTKRYIFTIGKAI